MTIKKIHREKCVACGRCVLVCPMDVIRFFGKYPFIAYPKDCMSCFMCETECPEGAVHVGPERASEKVLPY